MALPLEQAAVADFAGQQVPEVVNDFIGPLIETIKPVMGTVSAIVGGLFGLYLIFILFRLYYERKKVNLLKNICYDLDYLNQNFDLPYSSQTKFHKKVLPLVEYKEREKNKEKRRLEKQKIKEEKKLNKKKEKLKKKKNKEENGKRFVFF